ncbi:MAG: ABC transporter ATP-binding protein [Oscillospiraceae bacterium]
MALFGCKGVTRLYQGEEVIKDVALSLDEGELVSLLGVSGVGKTTLFHILSGVDVPDEGKVFLDGEDITGRAGQVGYMLQKDMLFPYKSIVDNVSLPLIIGGVPKKEARERAAEHFPQFGLAGYERNYPHQLSGGMRQRAALLRTFLMGSRVMLLDEPFSALDALTKLQLHDWYLEITAQLGVTTLFITHDVDEAIKLSDRVYLLSGKPGTITDELVIEPPRPRDRDFLLSPQFAGYKGRILKGIGL